MFKQKQDKFTANATPEKICQNKPFVQTERELTDAQLEAISKRSAEGQCAGGALTVN